MKSLIIVFGALLLIIATPFVFNAVDDAISESYSQSIAGITTGAGAYSSNVTLGNELYADTVTSITGVASNQTADTPTANSYGTTDHTVNITGLDQSLTRTLTVTYLIDHSTLPAGGATVVTLIRWFWIFIILGMVGGAIYAFFAD